ncbi:phospholipid/glycerol acyltransferase [Halothece sp. PCC 7418]|uniref:lysophospholipid acyltransferase family protein n=1 Tax=Halothece sp. (strain PCC 7418) TaxID=65093 RepID=UPI0002A05ABD|nr:lysophospholipid acyltransferase family protein [Halothece sp. PCC 7418]AFZ42981.1 phospholipid/glycerol acyltransferase [Halothece sp. PCC 7418]
MPDITVSPWLSRLVYPLGCYLLLPAYFGKLEIIGRENIPRNGPVLLAPTHRSRWDALLVPYTAGRWKTGRDLRYMVSENEMRGLQGWIIRRMGGFPVDPKHPGLSTIRNSIQVLSQGEMLVIFPEGDIYRNQPVQPLKAGIGRIALQAQSQRQVSESVKVVPMSIHYSQAYPNWGTGVKVKVGTPINVADYPSDHSKKSAQCLTQDLETALKDLYENDPAYKQFSCCDQLASHQHSTTEQSASMQH